MVSDFTILKEAEVSQTEYGKIVGVSRVTVNKWVGGAPIGLVHAARAEAVLKLIAVGVKSGAFPFKAETSDRLGEIKKKLVAIREALKKQREAQG